MVIRVKVFSEVSVFSVLNISTARQVSNLKAYRYDNLKPNNLNKLSTSST